MATHDIAHLVAHGRFRHDNPLWSTLELADGELSVYELERLGQIPSIIVLASCESGMGGTRSGAQLHGLAGTLLAMGARTIVAAIGALPDTDETRRTMIDLHRDLVNGTSASKSLLRQRVGGISLTSAGLVTLGVG
jgi:CHAT domain-containing protein